MNVSVGSILRKISRAYSDLNNIYDDTDLKKNNLSLSDYEEAKRVLQLVGAPGNKAETLIENVAKFYEKHDFGVKENENGNGFVISPCKEM